MNLKMENEQALKEKELSEEHGLEFYSDEGISSADARFPRWLSLTYIILPIWGFCTLYYFFNGSHGWLDPSYWNQLQKAALTTYPDKEQVQEGINRDQDAIVQWKAESRR